MTIFLRWLDRLPSWLRAGVVTGTFAALVPFLAAATSWLEDFFAWAAGDTVTFPDLSVLRSAAVGLASGAVIGGANALYRWAQERLDRGNPPVYPSKPNA